MKVTIEYLTELESEAIYIIREAAMQFKNVAILFSGGKDSIVLAHLTYKAFYPATIGIPLLHIDTGHNFEETIHYRDDFAKHYGFKIYVGSVQDDIDQGKIQDDTNGRNKLQSFTLLDRIKHYRFDALLGGGRRDEEKARAKERIFSHRDTKGGWNPNNQRPELWGLYNIAMHEGEHFRVFPISNWTEKDVWQYIEKEQIQLPQLYFSHKRKVVMYNGMLLAASSFLPKMEEENVREMNVRCRTIGDMTCTGLWESQASSLTEVIMELDTFEVSERGGRADDKTSDTAMEDRKREGYF